MQKLRPVKENSLLSLYTGAGGFDLGLEKAGFDPVLCLEKDEDARNTLKTNRKTWLLSEKKDILEMSAVDIVDEAKLQPGELALLSAGPPCQPFSKSGFWAKGGASRLDDPRALTIFSLLDVIEKALPAVVIIENVKGFIYKGKNEGIALINSQIHKINLKYGTHYQPQLFCINAADYGVPQIRERVFIVIHREGGTLNLPEKTHFPPDVLDTSSNKDAYLTAWDAIGSLNNQPLNPDLKLRGKWADLVPSIPEGCNYLWHTARGEGRDLFGWRTRYWSFLLKLSKRRPSWTIQASPGPSTGPLHWNNRQLSVQEICRLQTFPDNYTIQGSYKSAYRQVGNAVPPAIGELLGRAIQNQFFQSKLVSEALSFLPKRSHKCPLPNKIEPVPEKYLSLEGDHPSHPGTGLGPSKNPILKVAV